jgi:hypothetical protein
MSAPAYSPSLRSLNLGFCSAITRKSPIILKIYLVESYSPQLLGRFSMLKCFSKITIELVQQGNYQSITSTA